MTDAANPAEDFLIAEIDPKLYPLFPAALRRAYVTADQVIEAYPFLRTPGGRFQRGDLIACAAEYELQRLIETGQLQFEYSWEDYAKPTGKHLVIHTSRGRLTVSQVQEPNKGPRYAEFRDDYQLTNMPYMFEEMNRELTERRAKKHILLVHGYRELTFAHFMLPHRMKDQPIFRTVNLANVPHVVSAPTSPEGPSESPDPETLEHLVKLLHDNDE